MDEDTEQAAWQQHEQELQQRKAEELRQWRETKFLQIDRDLKLLKLFKYKLESEHEHQ